MDFKTIIKSKASAKVLFSLAIAFINAVCIQAVTTHACFGWGSIDYYKWRHYFFFSFIAAFVFFTIMDYLLSGKRADGVTLPKLPEKAKFLLPVLFFICWLPYLIKYAPGLVNYDTVNQLEDFFNGVSSVPFGYVEGQEEVTVYMNAHHPVFVTFIFGNFVKIGLALGSPAKGLTIYIVFQMILAAIILSYVIEKTAELDNNRHQVLKCATIAFFALCPVIPYYVCIMLKNSLHTILCVAYVFLYLIIALKNHVMTRNEKIAWIALSLLLSLTQNTGVYFVILTGIFLMIKSKENRIPILAGVIASAAIMLLILPKIIYPAMNIFPGGKQEVLGTLFQQTARFVRDHEDEVTEKDIEILSKVVDYGTLHDNYVFETTDNLKATYNLHATSKELSDFYKLWLSWGFRHPESYFRAILPICGEFFATGYNIGIFDHIPTNEGVFAQIAHTKPEEEYTALSEIYYWVRSFPGLDLLFQHALYVLWIPLYCIYRTLTSKKKSLFYIVPFIVNMLFLVVSPMVYSRYALPLIFTSPILLYMCVSTED
jgi:hypothetical protein